MPTQSWITGRARPREMLAALVSRGSWAKLCPVFLTSASERAAPAKPAHQFTDDLGDPGGLEGAQGPVTQEVAGTRVAEIQDEPEAVGRRPGGELLAHYIVAIDPQGALPEPQEGFRVRCFSQVQLPLGDRERQKQREGLGQAGEQDLDLPVAEQHVAL